MRAITKGRAPAMAGAAALCMAAVAVAGWAFPCAGCAAAGSERQPASETPAPGVRGAELLVPFKQELQKALREGLAAGPVEAISVCSVKAPEIVRALEKDGVRMGRTSHRLRNPSNTAPEWVDPILQEYVADPAARGPRTVELPAGRVGYAEAITVQTLCLACHGEKITPTIAARIAENYPEDRAVGFKAGDFRGLFWVEFPAHE